MIGYDSGYERAIRAVCRLNKKPQKCMKSLAKLLAALMRLIWPCDIDPGAEIGNVHIPHAVGIVIGYTAVVEDDVTIMSGVVVGGRYDHLARKGHAHICRGALLGANCVILGTVTVGEYAKIGAGAVVTKDVPPRAVVVGSNKIIRQDLPQAEGETEHERETQNRGCGRAVSQLLRK